MDTIQQEKCCFVLNVVRGEGDIVETPEIPTKQETLDKFAHLQDIQTFLEKLQLLKDLSRTQLTSFL